MCCRGRSAVSLVFDGLDAGRPDVLFVIQRILEREPLHLSIEHGSHAARFPDLCDRQHGRSRSDLTGLYHGTNVLNQAQVDRWNIVTKLDYLASMPRRRSCWPVYPRDRGLVDQMIAVAAMTRSASLQATCRRSCRRPSSAGPTMRRSSAMSSRRAVVPQQDRRSRRHLRQYWQTLSAPSCVREVAGVRSAAGGRLQVSESATLMSNVRSLERKRAAAFGAGDHR